MRGGLLPGQCTPAVTVLCGLWLPGVCVPSRLSLFTVGLARRRPPPPFHALPPPVLLVVAQSCGNSVQCSCKNQNPLLVLPFASYNGSCPGSNPKLTLWTLNGTADCIALYRRVPSRTVVVYLSLRVLGRCVVRVDGRMCMCVGLCGVSCHVCLRLCER